MVRDSLESGLVLSAMTGMGSECTGLVRQVPIWSDWVSCGLVLIGKVRCVMGELVKGSQRLGELRSVMVG